MTGDGPSGPDQDATPPVPSAAAQPADGAAAVTQPTSQLPDQPGKPAATMSDPPAPDQARWAARAPVRTPNPQPLVLPEWEVLEEAPPRAILVPTLAIICVLLLLGLVALGVWLGTRDRQPAPPATIATTSKRATTTQVTRPATQTATPVITTAAVVVTLPNLRGVDYPAAEDTLIALGLVPTRVDEISNELPAGQVLRTNPEPGPVAVGTNVTVVVSAGPPPPPPSPSEAATPSPT